MTETTTTCGCCADSTHVESNGSTFHIEKGWKHNVKIFIYQSILSRKLLVWATATLLFVLGTKVDMSGWITVSFAYMGANIADKVVNAVVKKG